MCGAARSLVSHAAKVDQLVAVSLKPFYMSFQAEFTSTGRLVLYEAEALVREDADVDVLFK